MIGTTAAIIAGLAASAGSSAISAKLQSNAAKDAAKIQTDYGNRALDLQQQVYRQQQANLAPYMQTGLQARNALTNFLGGGAVNIPGMQPGAGSYGNLGTTGRGPAVNPWATLSAYAGPPPMANYPGAPGGGPLPPSPMRPQIPSRALSDYAQR